MGSTKHRCPRHNLWIRIFLLQLAATIPFARSFAPSSTASWSVECSPVHADSVGVHQAIVTSSSSSSSSLLSLRSAGRPTWLFADPAEGGETDTAGTSGSNGSSGNSDGTVEEAVEEATYYSPNAPLKQSKFFSPDDEDASDMSNVGSLDGDGVIPNPENLEDAANEYSFFDEATIYVRAGSGGQGASTYKKGVGGQDGPADGGNGGRGGDVILNVDEALNTLAGLTNAWRPNSFGGSGAASSFQSQRKSFRADNGEDGKRQLKTGRGGRESTIRVPPGTVIQEIVEMEDGSKETIDFGSVTLDNPTVVVAMGGEGGEGSGIAGRGRGVVRKRIPPQGGERKVLKLTLKLVADVALVGVPNAGKSTLLASTTRAKPKIANYPFTTVIPNLGVWVPPDDTDDSTKRGAKRSLDGSGRDGLVLCDVPGLIAGASQGVGLGHAFLRHVERCHVILHLVDATSDDPVADFQMLNKEILNYGNGKLGQMPQVVVVNKLDILDGIDSGVEWEKGLKTRFSKEELQEKLRDSMPHTRLMWMSAKQGDGVDDLMTRLAGFVKKVKETA